MNKMFIAAAASVFILAGCSSEPEKATMSKMEQLTNQVAQLKSEVETLKSEKAAAEMKAQKASAAAMAAKEEAERANDRIDNIAQSYTK
ncbi:Lpp/OprI family alanine-zipper lipoprotein [Vibrio sp. Isolate31]|uniref:Lpp/OprI family alanine-zipper lipoprotein n=1 Tax=unclassified Vibrio TaxID=2614977 RepID=UPI001EFDDA96|nr:MULTISPECIES: Lpp/OprI family alanine-zipper lipoprotein [unclassified Vibrio]MCG9552709.1 Lpp/OprI family alanine-zipper lipoprotein [Vibrio sp. Isolate32]MCG9602742.1 Lpp/OprI family alanine-zipper lipoprotein [Vibrio sp. Isolate31]